MQALFRNDCSRHVSDHEEQAAEHQSPVPGTDLQQKTI
jgi:hypothetical protein